MRVHVAWILGSALLAVLAVHGISRPLAGGQAPPVTAPAQSALGPGLYVFQTRTRGSSCGDSERDGYVMSYFAAINGVPGNTGMTMELVNTPHFTTWTLVIAADTKLTGKSRIGSSATAPDSMFTVARDDDRWKGTGFRTYQGQLDGKPVRCRVDYDALLRRIDTRPRLEANEPQ